MARTKQKDGGTSHWLILVLLALAQFMVVLDVSIVNVALPSIQKAFSMSQTNLQWIVTAYTLTFGGFLLLGGRNADLFGRRRTFLAGVTVFTIASLVDGLAQSGNMLIFARAVQGLAGAYMSPAALSIVLVTYREGHERNVALSVWGAVASGGAAVGVLLGGILTQYLDWRWNFFVNVPVGILVVLASLRLLDRHESEATDRSLDLPGAVLGTGGLIALVYGLVKAPQYGWGSTHTLVILGGAAAALIAFVVNEHFARKPLMPLNIFRIRNLSGANLVAISMSAGLFANFFFTSLYLQLILGYSPVKTGLSFLIIPLVVAVVATSVPRVIQRVGYRPILMIAPLFLSGGLYWLSKIPVDGTYWGNVAPGMIIMAIGMGATFVSVSIAATSGVPHHEAGLASGILNTAQQVGGAVGLAILTGIATAETKNYFAQHNSALHDGITAPTQAQITHFAHAATVHGFQRGYLIAASFGIVGSLIATFVIRNQRAANDPSHADAAIAGV